MMRAYAATKLASAAASLGAICPAPTALMTAAKASRASEERSITGKSTRAEDRAKLLLFYCLRDCWMSWNAAKRAIALGYTVAWYPDGTDGWQDAGLPLSAAVPAPRPSD